MFLFQSIGFERDYTDTKGVSRWHFIWHANVIRTWFSFENSWNVISVMSRAHLLKRHELFMSNALSFAHLTCLWNVHSTPTWMSNGRIWQVHLVSPFDIHVDVEWIHVMSIWHSHGCQMDLFMYIWHPYWCLMDLHDFYWTCTWDVKWTNEGDGWKLWHVIRTCSGHGLGHDNNNVLKTWVRLWKQYISNTHQLQIIFLFMAIKSYKSHNSNTYPNLAGRI
jgi:hypothetical protein